MDRADGAHLGSIDQSYILDHDRARYANYSGTGNTLNANHSIVRRLILDNLRYWVAEMHVDGYRFDLASILARDENGHPLQRPPILWDIETDPVLAGTKLIAEAWDAAGLYQVGTFIGDSWKEWNGKFRDDVRSFMKGDRGVVGRFAHRLCASPDLYGHEEREAEQSINFITCHDGFTLNDLVSYNGKHNEANGEQNRDGADDNRSWNCGFEGPNEDPAIEELRNRQAKNFLALTLIALGIPMLLMGDEVRRTQHGNNNAYCQDNEISWFDWSLIERHRGLFRFVKALIAQRLRLVGMRDKTDLSLIAFLRHAEVQFHGVRLAQPDWSDDSHSLALTALNIGAGAILHIMINAYWEPLEFELPVQHGWRRWIDTARASPDDIVESGWPAFDGRTWVAQPRSLAALVARLPSNPPSLPVGPRTR
jgi:isoamylase